MIAASGSSRARRLGAVAGVLTGLLLPAVAAAHPLGNITINHYAGIRVGLGEIRLDVVIDQAEIPTFEVRSRLDADADGELSDAEVAAAREPECRELADSLELKVAGSAVTLTSSSADLSFPLGAGLPTTRLACEYVAALPAPIAIGGVEIEFTDRSYEGRLGWREIVVVGDGTTVEATDGEFLTHSPSERLTRYPTVSLTALPAMSTVMFRATPGGGAAPPAASPGGPAIPAEGLPAIFGASDLSPMIILVSLLTAIALGAFHALTPGHGKTLVAASLVGSRGTAVHAVGLGLAVTISHTLGILVLAALIVGARELLPAEVVADRLPLIAAVGIVAVGGWMLLAEVRRLRTATGGGPATHKAIGRRSLFALGLAGGIVPSTSALLILLGAIAAGRPAFGVVLVVAFGLGMAVVLGGVGMAVVRARSWVDRASVGTRFHEVHGYAPLAASIVVLALGVWLVAQSLPD
jgi:nickel/cobalt transporter (NicO) family protein